VKLSLCLIKHHDTKTYGGITPRIFNFCTTWKWVDDFGAATSPLGNRHRVALDRGLRGLRTGLGPVEETIVDPLSCNP
jgi:hypothetical protein